MKVVTIEILVILLKMKSSSRDLESCIKILYVMQLQNQEQSNITKHNNDLKVSIITSECNIKRKTRNIMKDKYKAKNITDIKRTLCYSYSSSR